VIAAYITGFARAQLYRFVKEHRLERNVVAFATDSIATTQQILNLNSNEPGEMKLDKEADDVISFCQMAFTASTGNGSSAALAMIGRRKSKFNIWIQW
jgi:hypothetical protein